MSKYHYGTNHIFTSRTDSRYIGINSGVDEILSFDTSIQINGDLQYVHKLEDLPNAVAGVITLEDEKTYIFLGTIDLGGNRIVAALNTIIKGTSSETSNLLSTGLADGVALFTSVKTIIFQDISIVDVHTVFDLQSNGGVNVIDWRAFNIENSPNIGLIDGYDNFIITDSAFLNCAGLVFDGTLGTIGFAGSIFTNFQNLPSITIADTCTITRRLKIIESSMVTTGSGNSIDFSTSTTVPNQGYILTSVNFSGGATHLIGVQPEDNKSLFFKNLGIKNSRSTGTFYLSAIVATATSSTWTKLLGTTNAGVINQKFSHSSNRLTYTGTLTQIFSVSYHVSTTGTNNNIIQIGVSYNGADPTADSTSVRTIDSGGAIGDQGLEYFIEMAESDYVELWIKNLSASNNVTATSMNIAISGAF